MSDSKNPAAPTPSIPASPATSSTDEPSSSSNAATPIHAPRVFLYFSLFFLPLVFSIAFLSSPTIWHASTTSSLNASASITFPPLFFADSYIGLVRICTGDATSNCRYLHDVCKDITSSSTGISNGICGDERKAAAAFAILAVIAGAAAMMAYIDNILVWKNLSVWYAPRNHTVSEVGRVRDSFRRVIVGCVSVHAVLLLIAVSLAVHLRGKVLDGVGVELFWGLWMGVVAIIADVLFLALFIVFDRVMFFSVPMGSKFDPLDA
ncbi:hypothetical protein HDU67_009922 [Dinochytrium kinnereticum]|nr:hypothetical protein HDU67_009922 [Dinochytrium kinnereticum]